jgi:HEPN domain-containing protein
METKLIKSLCEQLNNILAAAAELRGRSSYEDLSDIPGTEQHKLLSRQLAAIQRISDKNSAYYTQAQRILNEKTYEGTKVMHLCGVIEAIRTDLDEGYLQNITELIHGDVFSDFLDMARHLLEEKYKDAAAVIAGSALEAHLRALCQKNNIPTEVKVSGVLRQKKADMINAELVKGSAYSKLDQKSVTAWLDLRNKAAHGQYDEYTLDQVSLMIDGIRDFLVRVPA